MANLKDVPYYTPGRTTPLFGVDYMEELPKAWGGRHWGAQNHAGTLELVMVHRPGEENVASEIEEDPAFFNLPQGNINLEAMQKEHDAFTDILRGDGAEVIYLDPEPPRVGTYGVPLRGLVYSRTATAINGGILLDRNANHYKRGMEYFYAKKLLELGCPILYTVHGNGSFEASDLIFAKPDTAVLARSIRSNEEGLRQIEGMLRQNGIEDILYTDLPGYWGRRESQWGGSSGFFHLDAVFGMAAENVAVIYTGGVGYHLLEELDKRGIEIVEVSDAEVGNLAANLLVIRPGVVVLPEGNPETTRELERKGIKVHTLKMPELLKAGGGPKCITMPLVQH